MNGVELWRISGKKKPNTPELHYIRGPTKSPPTPMQIGISGKIMQKRHNLTGHNLPVGVGKRHFLLGRFRMYLP